ncbi:MAG: hypothetical protein NVV68_10785 [Dokdonella sp.]|nr:hypothetical protein [Dokdonella sp.]
MRRNIVEPDVAATADGPGRAGGARRCGRRRRDADRRHGDGRVGPRFGGRARGGCRRRTGGRRRCGGRRCRRHGRQIRHVEHLQDLRHGRIDMRRRGVLARHRCRFDRRIRGDRFGDLREHRGIERECGQLVVERRLLDQRQRRSRRRIARHVGHRRGCGRRRRFEVGLALEDLEEPCAQRLGAVLGDAALAQCGVDRAEALAARGRVVLAELMAQFDLLAVELDRGIGVLDRLDALAQSGVGQARLCAQRRDACVQFRQAARIVPVHAAVDRVGEIGLHALQRRQPSAQQVDLVLELAQRVDHAEVGVVERTRIRCRIDHLRFSPAAA